jgi:hypothetical protein
MSDRPKVRAMVGLRGDLTGKVSMKERAKLAESINPLTKIPLPGIAKESLRIWNIA